MKKIIISIIVMGLLLTTSIVTVNARACRPYIYVDDDNTQGPWDGTLEHPYQYIQDGIDNANEGDTIYVFSGLYDEYLELSKSVRLIGEDRDSTIINWSIEPEDFIDGITIRGFTVKSQGIHLYSSSFHKICENNFLDVRGVMLSNCSNCIVSNNIIKTSLDSIDLHAGSCNNTISGNYINAGRNGVSISDHSKDNVVTDNTITNNDDSGIDVSYDSDNNIISNNTITNNSWTGIRVDASDNNIISNNIITNNDWGGIWVSPESDNNIISNNIITNNNDSGIWVDVSDNNIISNNIITNSGWEGIWVLWSDNNIISNNTITNNSLGGIRVDVSNNNIISNNTITNNSHFGVSFTHPEDVDAPSYCNIFSGNTIRDNARFGIYVNMLCLGNFFCYNNFINNDQNAYDAGLNLWYNPFKKEGNYWDDYTGTDGDGNGIGDTPYRIPPWPFRNKDIYPIIDPIDTGNIEIENEMTNDMTNEESEELLQEQLNSQSNAESFISTYINGIINLDARIGSTPSTQQSAIPKQL